MSSDSNLVASVLYQGVPIAQNLPFSEVSMENAVVEMPDPLPVATELAIRVDHPDGQALGNAVVTRVRESRGAGEPGKMHLRWVEFSDADFTRLSGWVLNLGEVAPKKPTHEPAAPAPEPAPEPEPAVGAAPEPAPEPVAGVPEPVAGVPEPVEPDPAPDAGVPAPDAGVPAPVSDEAERTIPIDPGATSVDLLAIPDPPHEDAQGAETGAIEGGEEISVVEEGDSGGGEDGAGGDAGGAKKRRRRTKKK